MINNFMPGLDLSEHFYETVIRPILEQQFPEIKYSAARLDFGSDVLGFDTPMSMDHGWGPKLTIYLSKDDYQANYGILHDYFAKHLPFEVLGFPTHFGEPLTDGGVMIPRNTYPIHHMVTFSTPEKWFIEYLGVDIHIPMTPSIWLTIPQQRLATLRAGPILFDGLERISEIRQKFNWYPHDVWLYLLASQWRRIDQDEPFIGRAGQIGDELGSRLIAARLVTDLIHLGFLMCKTYPTYRKWLGSSFQQLEIAHNIMPIFEKILDSKDWKNREKYLNQAYYFFMEKHNALGITPFIKPEIANFHNRPFLVPHAGRFADSLLEHIKDPTIKSLPPYLGGIDQISDNTDILDDITYCQKMQSLFH